MRLLYPCNPLEKKKPDEAFQEEFLAAQEAGLPYAFFSAEDFEANEFKPRPALTEGEEVLYRGWMLTPEGFAKLFSAVVGWGGRMLTTPEQYRHCHYLPEWYPLCADVTPKTIFLKPDANFSSVLNETGWGEYFVKDYVKSLTTSRGSVAKNAHEVKEIVGLIEKYRGQVEGGVCVRELEDLRPETEERFFVFRKQAYARDGAVPPIVTEIARRIDSPFFSVDIVLGANGAPRLIELGDGQVSDRKKWTPERFVEIFRGYNRFETDGLPFRCAPGQTAAQAER